MFTDFGPLQRHEGKPENGEATSIVGNPDVAWKDGDNSTYATIQYGGFENPWGHVAAQMLSLPMDPALANTVTDVIATWTARLVQLDPTSDPGYGSSVAPFIRLGLADEGNAGPNWHTLADAAWWGNNNQSLYYAKNPSAPWEEMYLPEDGSWRTFRERLVPIYTDRTLQQLLSHDFAGTNRPTPATMASLGTIDVDHSYLIIYQDSFWSEEKFAVSEISLEFVGLNPDTVIETGGISARARFT